MTRPAPDELMAVAVVAGLHGLRGDLKLRPLPTAAAALSSLGELFFPSAAGTLQSYLVLHSKPHKQHQLVRLAGLESLDLAQPLVGQTALARCQDLPERPAGEHYWHELEGLAVIDRQRGPIGQVVGLFATGAHEILTVDGPLGEILIPFLPRFVLGSDPDTQALRVDLPVGLVPGDDAL